MESNRKNYTVVAVGIVLIIAAIGTALWIRQSDQIISQNQNQIITEQKPVVNNNEQNNATPNQSSTTTRAPTGAIQPIKVVAEGLSVPWDIAFLSDGEMLVTERVGTVVRINKNGDKERIKLPQVKTTGEGGLLGMVIHPNFAQNNYIYLYMSTKENAFGTENAVFRYTYSEGQLKDEKIIIQDIPGALYHDGGRMEFGPDGFLYITTGDAQDEKIAQNKNSLGGKILRLHDDGKVPADNPFGIAVWSYGHRNPQGLAWDEQGRLWETEHGRSGIQSGLDEINLIEKGKNYGWPTIEGDETRTGMEKPALHSGSRDTWAPASAIFYNGRLFFGGLKGEALYEATLTDGQATNLKSHFKNQYGRIRTVRIGPDGMFYMTTSNRDGRGKPVAGDDKIIRIDPRTL